MISPGLTFVSFRSLLFTSCLIIFISSRLSECSQDRKSAQEAFKNQTRDSHHLKEHLIEEMGMNEEAAMKYLNETSSDVQFFLMHDYDNNSKLDGLELLQSFSHHEHSQHEDQEHASQSREDDVVSFVDLVLQDSDLNDDGYIDFLEFATSIRHSSDRAEGAK
ncbi:multiple coagulation factor deficiency protein 2 homolog [Acropora palmata]|uniref:multiple coagulation factor deficiency protein 2 homolog n=1 Tax=Acropora palmata TaxID=6131 RepID=UPI003DA0AA7B